ncbi:unnamed protein product [Urochloa humidicola]
MSPAAGDPSRSASSIIASTTTGYHILKIDGYSLTMGTLTGDYLKSHPFTLGGHQWVIHYYPNGETSEVKDYISIFLRLDETVAKTVKAGYQFRLADKVGEQPLTLDPVSSFGSNNGWGYAKFIRREELEKSRHLKGDCFTVRCDIVIVNEFCCAVEEMAVDAPPRFVTVPPSTLHQHFGDLLLTEKGADVIFDVGGQTFAAHRCVLAARSPVFNAELFGTMKESDTAGVIRVDDMEAQVFKALLYFVYTDSLPKTKKAQRQKDPRVVPARAARADGGVAAADPSSGSPYAAPPPEPAAGSPRGLQGRRRRGSFSPSLGSLAGAAAMVNGKCRRWVVCGGAGEAGSGAPATGSGVHGAGSAAWCGGSDGGSATACAWKMAAWWQRCGGRAAGGTLVAPVRRQLAAGRLRKDVDPQPWGTSARQRRQAGDGHARALLQGEEAWWWLRARAKETPGLGHRERAGAEAASHPACGHDGAVATNWAVTWAAACAAQAVWGGRRLLQGEAAASSVVVARTRSGGGWRVQQWWM